MEKSIQASSRKVYLDILRVLASLAVILIHVSSENWRASFGTAAWNVFNVTDALSRWAVPVFVMISGALFLDPDRPFDMRKLYSKNILRLVTTLIFWCAVYAAESHLRGGKIKSVVAILISGTSYMWFMYMLIGLYMIVPLLRQITASQKMTEYFLLLGAIFTFLLPRIFSMIKLLNLTDEYGIISSFSKVHSRFEFRFTLGYATYFVLGFYLAKYDVKPALRRISYVVGPASGIAVALLTKWYSVSIGKADELFYSYMSILVLFTSISLFLFVKYVIGNLCGRKCTKALKVLSDCSFGCYLVHILVRNVFKYDFKLTSLTFNPLVSEAVLFFGIAMISYLFSYLLNTLARNRRFRWIKYIV